MTKANLLALLAAMVLLLALPAVVLAQAQPPRPAVFGGTATLDGAPAADGTVVAAWIDGNQIASTTAAGGAYGLSIAQPPGESFGGKIVFFTIGGAEAPERGTWQPDGGAELNLTASGMMMMMRGAAVVGTAWSGLNEFLVDRNGMTLYLFTDDTQGLSGGDPKSACASEKCMTAWPPYTTEGDPVAAGRARAKNLGSYEHPSGVTQATYNGWPLYYYWRDKNPGDVMGQYGAWYVVSRNGNLLVGGTNSDPAGAKGEKGDTGPAGKAGKAGAAGPGGVAGPGGNAGAAGKAGAAGAAGKDGAAGSAGAAGKAGAKGGTGSAGKDGAAGSAGAKGAVGPAGQAGASGGGGALGVIALIIAIVAVAAAGGAIVMGRRT